jgi:hypothetical protein
MSFNLDHYSRYIKTEKTVFNGNPTFGLYKRPEIFDQLTDDDIQYFKIDWRYVGRPDLIALDAYGSHQFYWILVMYNNPKNPIGWPFINTTIKIPNQSAIISLLG